MSTDTTAHLAAARREVADVFVRAGIFLDGDAAIDAELLEIANKAGGSLVRYHMHGAGVPFSAMTDAIKLAAALRVVLGFSPTPTPNEILVTTMAAGSSRPEVCPDCREVGLCDHDCATAITAGWAREAVSSVTLQEATDA